MSLSTNSLSRKYEEISAVRNVSIQLERSSILAVMGPSGSGKSTLMRLMACLETPTAGSVELEGRTVASAAGTESVWPAVTAVFQQLFLWPHLTLRSNILLPLRHLEASERADRLVEATELFDMDSFLDRFPNETSGGQRQRAALARAFVVKPDYILLDEVTSALDLEQQDRLSSYLRALSQSGLGILIITHSTTFAESCADQVVCLRGGAIAATGTGADLLEPESRLRRKLSDSVNDDT